MFGYCVWGLLRELGVLVFVFVFGYTALFAGSQFSGPGIVPGPLR